MTPSSETGPEQPPANTNNVCQFLGLSYDSESLFAFPSAGNYCHRVKTPRPIAISHQEAVCLSGKHKTCPVYQEEWKGALPREIRAQRNWRIRWSWLGGVAVVAVLLFILSRTAIGRSLSALLFLGAQGTEIPPVTTPLATITPALINPSVPISSETPTLLLPATPSRTATVGILIPTIGPGLMTPFGPQEQYLLHELQESESLAVVARYYQSTISVLNALNIPPPRLWWPGDVLVVMPGRTDPAGLIPFRVIHVEVTTRVIDLSEEYSVPVEDIRMYNSLGSGDWIPAGRWVIIPVYEEGS